MDGRGMLRGHPPGKEAEMAECLAEQAFRR